MVPSKTHLILRVVTAAVLVFDTLITLTYVDFTLTKLVYTTWAQQESANAWHKLRFK